MRLCYLHPVPLVTARGKTACPRCGTSYPFLPGTVPKPDAGQLLDGRGALSSRPVSVEAFYTPSAPLAGRADAAPGGSHPQQAGRGTRTQETEMTTKPNDGDAAFPEPFDGHGGGERGMPLRDYFAGQAIVAVLSTESLVRGAQAQAEKRGKDFHSHLAELSFSVADAMLAAREETQS